MEAMEITNIVDPSGNKEVAIGIKIPKVPQDVPVEKERPAPTINKHASRGLVYGTFVTLVFVFILYIPRKIISYNEYVEFIADGEYSNYVWSNGETGKTLKTNTPGIYSASAQ